MSRPTTCTVTVTSTILYVEIAAKYDGENVITMKWYRQNLTIIESGDKEWKGGNTDKTVRVPGTGSVDVVVGGYFLWRASCAGYGIKKDKLSFKDIFVFAPDAEHTAGNNIFGIPEGLSKDNALLFFPAAGYGDECYMSV